MWIRTQHRKFLIKANNIGIVSGNVIWYGAERDVIIGKYATEKRALEVLDEIENTIHDDNLPKVYQMPKEEKE